jgi:hypothetical protein
MELRRLLKDFKKLTAAAVICASAFMYAASSESASSAFVEACKSYSRGDWSDAKFMLKKAVLPKPLPPSFMPDSAFPSMVNRPSDIINSSFVARMPSSATASDT